MAAAMITGTPEQLTTYVENHLGDAVGIDGERLAAFKENVEN